MRVLIVNTKIRKSILTRKRYALGFITYCHLADSFKCSKCIHIFRGCLVSARSKKVKL